jgi:hypothetical protein
VVGGWRKFCNEELYNLCISPYTTSMVRLRRMRRAGHITHMREVRNAYKILVGNLKGRDHLKDLG